MPFDLKLTFTGMMLHVPGPSELHVLMPRTAETIPAPVLSPEGGGCSGGSATEDCVEPHAPRLTFDTAYLRPGMQALDDVVAHVSLLQKRLDLPELGDAYERGIPGAIATTPSPVRPDVLDGSADDELAARIRIRRGRATWADPGECWEYQSSTRRMSHQVEWVVANVPDEYIELQLTSLAGLASPRTLPRLYPINGQMELWVWHAPAIELPPDAIVPETAADGMLGHHFGHLGRLLDSRSLEMPVYRPEDCPPLPPGTRRAGDRDKGGATLTCTSAQAPV